MTSSKLLLVSLILAAVLPTWAERQITNLTDGWEFSRDRQSWESVRVPHDWAIHEGFNPDGESRSGKLPWKGKGYYKKDLVIPEFSSSSRYLLEFDGVMSRCLVRINGEPCGQGTYGYLGFQADLTPYLHPGTNQLEVSVDTTRHSSRWYPGAGIYRPVRLVQTSDLYFDTRELFVTTPIVTNTYAQALISGTLVSRRATDEAGNMRIKVYDPNGRVVVDQVRSHQIPSYGQAPFAIRVLIPEPKLWTMSPDAALYRVEVAFASQDHVFDTVSTRVGIRTFKFDPKEGFFLNGENIRLKGVNLHSDLGILGMAFNRSACRRILNKMRDLGVNAIRTSHNPPAPELLDLCDEMGFFVWDECFDKWDETADRAADEPLEEFVEGHLATFVRRDRNHPSIFVWSIGNEIPLAKTPDELATSTHFHTDSVGTTAERCARFRQVVRALDATRPVGIGSCFQRAATRGDYAALDITGWNYGEQYKTMHRCYPDKPLIYSESASAFSVYGVYADRLATAKTAYMERERLVDSYDRNSAAWSDIPDREFERMERDRYVAGEFVWTGVDYLGEPTPFMSEKTQTGTPLPNVERARSSYFGINDLLGLPKDRSYLYRAHWNKDVVTVHLVPDHWSFPERKGQTLPVYLYTNGESAELFLNGVSQGKRAKDAKATMLKGDYYANLPRYRLVWDAVPYEEGELKAVAYDAEGQVIGEEVLRTAGAAAKVVLTPEATDLPDDPDELVFVEVSLADAQNTRIPRDNRRVSFAVEGAGEIVAVGNSDPRAFENFTKVESHALFNGRAGLFIRRTGPGKVTLKASATDLIPAQIQW